jgi:hypothetical protein
MEGRFSARGSIGAILCLVVRDLIDIEEGRRSIGLKERIDDLGLINAVGRERIVSLDVVELLTRGRTHPICFSTTFSARPNDS